MGIVFLGLLVIGGTVLFAVCGLMIARQAIRRHIAASHNEVAISLFATAGVIYAVLLGFLVVVVWEAYDNAQRNVAEEAATLVSLYRLTYGMEAAEGADMRVLVRGYTNAVITDEWPRLGDEAAGSNKARKAIGDIDRLFAKMDPATKVTDARVDAEFLSTKSSIVSDRNVRLLEASETTPWIIWLGAFGGGAIVIIMSCFIAMQRAGPHLLMSGMMASLIGLLLFIVLALSQPFTGPLALNPKHFQRALAVMDEVDHGN